MLNSIQLHDIIHEEEVQRSLPQKRRLTRLSSQEAVDRYHRGYGSDSSDNANNTRPFRDHSSLPSSAVSLPMEPERVEMSSQEAVTRFIESTANGSDDSE